MLYLLLACAPTTDPSLPERPASSGAPGAPDAAWTSAVQGGIAVTEYSFRVEGSAVHATNRAQDLRVVFDGGGVTIGPRVRARDNVTLRLSAWGRDALRAAEPAEPALGACAAGGETDVFGECLRRVELARDGVVEWWENRPEGLEQGFVVTDPQAGDGPLRLVLEVEGAAVAEADDDLVLTPGTGPALRYAGARAWDERGRDLPVALHARPDGLELVVDDDGALGAVTIDPLLTTVEWELYAGQSSAQLGAAIAGAGDVNGDGYADVIVGAPYYDNGSTNEGKAWVYLGAASGLSTTATWTAESNRTNSLYGISVDGAGDVNGDGYDDVIVGESAYTSGQTYEGRAFVYHGSASGLSASAAWSPESNAAYARMGRSVAGAGDVNADGYADVVVGLPGYSNGESYEGAAWVYLGAATGLSTSATVIESDAVSASAGTTVASAGDTNNDGYDDVLVGAPTYTDVGTYEGLVRVYLGGATGVDTTAIWEATGGVTDAQLGLAVACAGDVDGDGYDDIVVGAPGYRHGSTNEGAAFLYAGSASGPESTAAWQVEGDATSATFGYAVDGASDVDGDGYDDVLVGASGWSSAAGTGAAFLYYGSADGLATEAGWDDTSMATHASGNGKAVAGVGDVDGDGFADVLVADPDHAWSPQHGGIVRLYHGFGVGVGVSASADWTRGGDAVQAFFGWDVDSAGDVNGDGYADLIVGAKGYDNGSTDEGRAFVFHGSSAGPATSASWTAESNQAYANFGQAVSAAGDVNGDGYDDVIVTADTYDNGSSDEGAAFVYHGSAAGLGASASWTGESNQANASYGYAAAGIGDVNHDGYADIAVGAYEYTNGQTYEGRVYVYHGSRTGLATSASWTEEPDINRAAFGFAVAGAGDVNCDGYDDLIVGSPQYNPYGDGYGRALVYHGSSAGLSGTAAWTADGEYSEEWSVAVASAGDVNGDGCGDVLVGGPDYSNGESTEGRAVLYLGSGAGLSTTADAQLEGEQAGAALGAAVDGAGDVNGDGYDDIVVGATDYDDGESGEGAAFLWLGSADGLVDGAVSWQGESDYAFASYGVSVAGAGDVNGDGYDDLVVGAHAMEDGHTQEGLVYLYYGRSNQTEFYIDDDGDGYGDDTAPSVTGYGTVRDGYSAVGGDCDDAAVDEDCDGLADDDDPGLDLSTATVYYADTDGDGAGGSVSEAFCVAPAGYVATSTDCDDARAATHPGAVEAVGGGADDDCDGAVTCYADADGDGYRTSTTASYAVTAGSTGACTGGGRAAASLPSGDCADTVAAVNPGATEVCDAADTDEDCDGAADDADGGATGKATYYADTDGDGHGGTTAGAYCDAPAGWGASSTDCDDGAAAIHPSATETAADGTDANCDGQEQCYQDADGDGYRTASLVAYSVSAGATGACTGSGRAASSVAATDCADADAAIHPGAAEVCDAADTDEDCDGLADDTDPGVSASSRTTWWLDADADGYGGPTSVSACERPAGYTAVSGDCADGTAAIHPGAADSVADGVDTDCDGLEQCYVDADGDGFRSDDARTIVGADGTCTAAGEALAAVEGGDCDDADPDVNPAADELPGDGADSDCDGAERCYVDADGDGYRADDTTIPSADLACDAAGECGADAGTGDCDDGDAARHPDAPEPDCDDPVDYNCDGSAARVDADGDGWPACEECDDSAPGVNPDAVERCDDGVDDDCDGRVDEGCSDSAPSVDDTSGDDTGKSRPPKDDGGCAGCASSPGPGPAALALWLAAAHALSRRGRRRG